MNKFQIDSRLLAINISEKHGGIHFGGIFSCIDFLLAFYNIIFNSIKQEDHKYAYYSGINNHSNVQFFLSKGHCYLAQLISLDLIFNKDFYSSKYMQSLRFSGHPKKTNNNFHFPVSSGSLGQAVTVATGFAFANKRNANCLKVFCMMGDGEFNEGSVIESMRFASSFKLPIVFILDDNDQISLSNNILGFKCYSSLCDSLSMNYIEINGNNFFECEDSINRIINSDSILNEPIFIRLKTTKGFGIDFMEKNYMWHHRRAKKDELLSAKNYLRQFI
jgi:transketolase